MCPHAPTPPPDRRGFLKRTAAVVIGGIITLVPAAAGITVFFDPLRRRAKQSTGLQKVGNLEALPADGVPRKFAVIADRSDAWNKFPQVPIGAVYLRRTEDKKVEALNVVCPHAGCFVDFVEKSGSYLCPCHNSTFAADGKINDPKSPSPRGLDALEVEIRNENEIWVKFQNFQAGHKEKIPTA